MPPFFLVCDVCDSTCPIAVHRALIGHPLAARKTSRSNMGRAPKRPAQPAYSAGSKDQQRRASLSAAAGAVSPRPQPQGRRGAAAVSPCAAWSAPTYAAAVRRGGPDAPGRASPQPEDALSDHSGVPSQPSSSGGAAGVTLPGALPARVAEFP